MFREVNRSLERKRKERTPGTEVGRKVAVAVGDEVKSPEVLVSVSLIGPVGQPFGCGNNLGVNIDIFQVCLSIFVSGSSHCPNQAKETETESWDQGSKEETCQGPADVTSKVVERRRRRRRK